MKYRIKTMTYVGQEVVKSIRTDLFNHLQKLPFSYYDSRPHGKILVRAIGESITIGILIAFVSYIWIFWNPIVNIANFYNTLIM